MNLYHAVYNQMVSAKLVEMIRHHLVLNYYYQNFLKSKTQVFSLFKCLFFCAIS